MIYDLIDLQQAGSPMVSPKYSRVQNAIVNMIATQNIKVGEKLPNEKQLSESFEVGIITIRRAVKHLEENNIVRRERDAVLSS